MDFSRWRLRKDFKSLAGDVEYHLRPVSRRRIILLAYHVKLVNDATVASRQVFPGIVDRSNEKLPDGSLVAFPLSGAITASQTSYTGGGIQNSHQAGGNYYVGLNEIGFPQMLNEQMTFMVKISSGKAGDLWTISVLYLEELLEGETHD